MEWSVIFAPAFLVWFESQDEGLQDAIAVHAGVLASFGPSLGRPRVDSIKGSRYGNLKELRVQYAGEPWRILFAFDPERSAILLVGGNKTGDARWYKKAIPLADKLYEEHLKQLEDAING